MIFVKSRAGLRGKLGGAGRSCSPGCSRGCGAPGPGAELWINYRPGIPHPPRQRGPAPEPRATAAKGSFYLLHCLSSLPKRDGDGNTLQKFLRGEKIEMFLILSGIVGSCLFLQEKKKQKGGKKRMKI